MSKLLKDPLLHFLVLGGLLFAISLWSGGDGDDEARIVVTAGQIQQLQRSASLLRGRPPSDAELLDLIEPAIRDEVYYREALALGLDVDDDEVRRRLIEKMQYLTVDLADPEPASAEALRAFFDAAPQRFAIPERVTFDQVYFSPQMRGASLDGDVESALRELIAGGAPAEFGDRTPLQPRFSDAPREQVDVLFGAALTDAVFTLEPDGWIGPYRSDFGLHLVRIVSRSPARLPPFDEVREQVLQTYAADKRAERNAAEYARMRARYDIVVEWPLPGADAAAGAEMPQ